jgi:uncharacterized membrane protein HdeD (DUF308 family)
MQSQVDSRTLDQLARNWWMLAVRGVIGIAFGGLAIVLPGLTLAFLILLFGAYAFVDGVFSIASGLRKDPTHSRDWALVVVGIAGVIAGVIAFVSPGLTALALLLVIAAWAVVRGVFELIAALRLRGEAQGVWALALSGVFSLVFGILVFAFPGAGALAIVFWIGVWSIIAGAMLVIVSFRLRTLFRARSNSHLPPMHASPSG